MIGLYKTTLIERFCVLYSGTMGLKHNPKFINSLAERFTDIDFLVELCIGFDYLKKLPPKRNLILKPLQPMHKFSMSLVQQTFAWRS